MEKKKTSAAIQRTVFSGPLMPSSTITARDGKCSDFLYWKSLFSHLIILTGDGNFMFFSLYPIMAQNPLSNCQYGSQAQVSSSNRSRTRLLSGCRALH